MMLGQLYASAPRPAVLLIMIVYLVTCPYTKVEESFNIQAIHDILYHGVNLTKYDHYAFPGVVPRSFVAPIFISCLSLPSVSLLSMMVKMKILTQYLVRFWIGFFFIFCLCKFRSAVHKEFGVDTVLHFFLVTASQFHFLFYATRPLPNTFALCLVLLAFSFWIKQQMVKFVWISAFAIIIFRFELCILLGMCLLQSLLRGHISIKTLLSNAIPAGLTALCLTVSIDSMFWDRWLWPEGEVAWFNIVLNKSGEWGTSPFHWYFTSALPRALLTSLFFIPWALRIDRRRCLSIFFPAIFYVIVFSFLPHKELRFIVYTIPIFNTLVARAYSDLYFRRHKGLKWNIIYALSVCALLFNLLLSLVFLSASVSNYPGGEMMDILHRKNHCKEDVHVHISNYAAQTGVTRFTEACTNWRYNKTEGLRFEDLLEDTTMTHIIAEYKDIDVRKWSVSHCKIATVEAFSGFGVKKEHFLGVNFPRPVLKTSPVLFLLRRKSFMGSTISCD